MAGGSAGELAGGDPTRRPQPLAGGFLRLLLPTPKPPVFSSPSPSAAVLVPPHLLMAPPPPPDERLYIIRPTRTHTSAAVPPPPPEDRRVIVPRTRLHAAAPPPRWRQRQSRAVDRRKAGPFAGKGGGEAAVAVGDGAQKVRKVWAAVGRKKEEEVVDAEDGHGGQEEGFVEERMEEQEEEEEEEVVVELDGVLEEEMKSYLVVSDGSNGDGGQKGGGGGGGDGGRRELWSEDFRSDCPRGHQVSGLRARIHRRQIECRHDIETLSACLVSLYESLKPSEEEKSKQKQLVDLLTKSVNKEWPDAQLHLYGSCANSFGVSNCDVDFCLSIDESAGSRNDVLLKLADVIELDNFENVEAITNARVPIVRLVDPESGISCDMCVNNLFAVANTKLLKDYAKIDDRLPQLAFIVKHWAKSRGINETYRGTLSSYAYVLMCINFLQLRKPSILPCLQAMDPTYNLIVDDTECSYFDETYKLDGFGAENKESVASLLWGFFHYWAYHHDFMNDVISVRAGSVISKLEKGWTTRVGNDRHLICIEDPFETSHDLGRVVNKHTIRILREEFERAADILQCDANPCVTLFEPYVFQPDLLSSYLNGNGEKNSHSDKR